MWPMTGKTGAARVALLTKAPVIPVAQWGANVAMPPYAKRSSGLFPRKTLRVMAGPPVDLSASTAGSRPPRCCARPPRSSWPPSPSCWRSCAASPRPPSRTTTARPRHRSGARQRKRGDVTRGAVFGTGSWGTAFAMVLADAGCEVTLWGRRPELVDAINTARTNPDYLPGVELPDGVRATTDPARGGARRRVHRARRPLPDAARQPRRMGARCCPPTRSWSP